MVKSTLGSNLLYNPTQLSLYSLRGKARCEIQLEYVYWLGFHISFNNTIRKEKPEWGGKSQSHRTGNWVPCIKYFERESHQKTDSSRGSVWWEHPRINEVPIVEKWAPISTNPKVQNLLHHSGLSFQVSCLLFHRTTRDSPSFPWNTTWRFLQ